MKKTNLDNWHQYEQLDNSRRPLRGELREQYWVGIKRIKQMSLPNNYGGLLVASWTMYKNIPRMKKKVNIWISSILK